MINVPLETRVRCTDGVVGTSVALIYDAAELRISHLIIRQAEELHTKRLVPVDLVMASNEDVIELACSLSDVQHLEGFSETAPVPAHALDDRILLRLDDKTVPEVPDAPGAAGRQGINPGISHEVARTDGRRSTGLALALLATAQLILALDYSIVNVALPDIGRSLGFTGGRVQWVISAYALTYGGFLLLGGRTADLLGLRRVWVGALAVFALASTAGGLALDPVLLVSSRALQGAAGAFLFPATLALVNSTFEEGPKRTRAIAIWGSAGASGIALGVLAGGVLTAMFGWRAVFFVNVPIAVVLLALAPIALRKQARDPVRERFDLPGAFLVTAGTMAIVFALVEAPTVGWLSRVPVVSAAVGLALLVAFVVVELRSDAPLIPMRLLRIRSLRGGLIVAAAWMSSFGMQLYFLTIYLQQVLDESPLRAGLSFLPLAISIVIGTQLGGRLVGRIGIARTLAAGMAFGAAGLFLYLRLPADGSLTDLIPGMIAAGLGQGVAFTTMYVAASAGVPQGNQGVASATVMTAQQLGGSIGLALLVALLTERVKALGGTISAYSIRPAGVATSALHLNFAAQGVFAIVGAAAALFVIGGGWRGRPRGAERGDRDRANTKAGERPFAGNGVPMEEGVRR